MVSHSKNIPLCHTPGSAQLLPQYPLHPTHTGTTFWSLLRISKSYNKNYNWNSGTLTQSGRTDTESKETFGSKSISHIFPITSEPDFFPLSLRSDKFTNSLYLMGRNYSFIEINCFIIIEIIALLLKFRILSI